MDAQSIADTASCFSEEAEAPVAALYTCLSCQVAFKTPTDQRGHMRSDWHRYNLKRKVAELPPVSAQVFADKLEIIQQKGAPVNAPVSDRSNLECVTCRKVYNSENAYANHLSSKKHREAVTIAESQPKKAAPVAASSVPPPSSTAEKKKTDWHSLLLAAQTEDEILEILERKKNESVALTVKDCLFCTHQSTDLESNVDHMVQAHSFFIPDFEFLTDLEGLILYLGEKLSVANLCLYCNGKGRGFHTLEAVRGHMVSKGHCKILYEDGADLEIAEFYDFSETWEDVDEEDAVMEEGEDADGEWEDADNSVKRPARISPDESELILPSGFRVGHRSLKTYYDQSLRPSNNEQLDLFKRLTKKYKCLGYYSEASAHTSSSLIIKERMKRVAAHEKEMIAKKQNYQRQDYKLRMGLKNNGLMKHFRNHLGFST